jgi:hypothetical protein
MALVFISRCFSSDLRALIQVSRHGNRAPSHVFNHLVAKGYEDLNFALDSSRELHPSGVE